MFFRPFVIGLFVVGISTATAFAAPGDQGLDRRPIDPPGLSGPNFAATPELDSLALFSAGLVSVAGYGLLRLRVARRR